MSKNPSCTTSGPLLGASPCAAYIGVYCSTVECSWNIKAFSETGRWHTILDGSPTSDVIRDGKSNYYILDAEDYTEDNVYIDLQIQRGDVNIFVEIIDISGPESVWDVPQESNSNFLITSTSTAHLLHISTNQHFFSPMFHRI